MKQGLCLSEGKKTVSALISAAVVQAFSSCSVPSLPCRGPAMKPAGLRSSLQRLLCWYQRTTWTLIPNPSGQFSHLSKIRETSSLEGRPLHTWGPSAHGVLHPLGIRAQLRFWIFGWDPGVTSVKSMDFPQIYSSIMNQEFGPLCHIVRILINFK